MEEKMQIMDTRIAPEGVMMTVEFLGEGGELVSITMDNSEHQITAANAVDRAKVLLVQLTAFETATVEPQASLNRYDALSNGNLDEGMSPERGDVAFDDDDATSSKDNDGETDRSHGETPLREQH
jgi:hypothetical protein